MLKIYRTPPIKNPGYANDDVYMTASFAAVRKPKHRNFQISARKPSQMQFVGCQNSVKPNAFCLGSLLLREQQIRRNNRPMKFNRRCTVFIRCKTIFINSKNTKLKHSKEYSVIFRIFCTVKIKKTFGRRFRIPHLAILRTAYDTSLAISPTICFAVTR